MTEKYDDSSVKIPIHYTDWFNNEDQQYHLKKQVMLPTRIFMDGEEKIFHHTHIDARNLMDIVGMTRNTQRSCAVELIVKKDKPARHLGGIIHQIMPVTHVFHRMPSAISELENAIGDAAELTALQEDWDDDGALPITQEIYEAASDFLRQYAYHLYNHWGISIPIPEINPCKNGSIDLAWRTENARLLINIRPGEGEYFAYFYGDRQNNKNSIKGNTSVDEFYESLAVWMKYLA